MIQVEVLGFDCAACRKAYQLITQLAAELNIAIDCQKIDDPQKFIHYQVMTAPGIIVDGKLVYQGGCPDRNSIIDWLQAAT